MTDLSELIERVKAATGPSAALDAEIYATIGGAPNTANAGQRIVPLVLKGDPKEWPTYTASIDAALALVERCLPGWTLARLSQDDHKLWYVELRQGHATSYGRVVIAPSTIHGLPLPLAIILALLLALESQP